MFQNTCDNVPEHYRNVPEYFWKYCETLLKFFETLLKMFRNTFENVPEHYRNVPKLFELFRNTFENIPKQFLKTVLMFRNNIPKHLWQCSGAHFWKCSGTIWNVPEHFWKRNTFENCLNVLEQYRNVPELFWKYCGTIFEMFRFIFEIVPKRFWNVPEHFLKNRGIMKTNISVKY